MFLFPDSEHFSVLDSSIKIAYLAAGIRRLILEWMTFLKTAEEMFYFEIQQQAVMDLVHSGLMATLLSEEL